MPKKSVSTVLPKDNTPKAPRKRKKRVYKYKIKTGRPPKYNTPQELQSKIDEYFKNVPEKEFVVNDDKIKVVGVHTITGLILHCGFCDRQSFYAYEKKPEFSYTIKRARSRMEQHYEELIQGSTPAGSIFALKNFGWRDKQELDLTMKEYKYVEYRDTSNSALESRATELAERIMSNRGRTSLPQKGQPS